MQGIKKKVETKLMWARRTQGNQSRGTGQRGSIDMNQNFEEEEKASRTWKQDASLHCI